MSNAIQLRIIHAVKREAGIKEGEYRDLLRDMFDRGSSSDLTEKQADEFITHLRVLAGQQTGGKGVNPHTHLDNRPGFASSKQLGMLEGMWSEVSVAENKRKALESFLRGRFRINGLAWIREHEVRKIHTAISAMQAQKKKGVAHVA